MATRGGVGVQRFGLKHNFLFWNVNIDVYSDFPTIETINYTPDFFLLVVCLEEYILKLAKALNLQHKNCLNDYLLGKTEILGMS